MDHRDDTPVISREQPGTGERPVSTSASRRRRLRHMASWLTVAAAVLSAAALVAAACGGGGDGEETPAADDTPTPGANAGLKSPIAITPGDVLVAQDLDARGRGRPGRGEFTGDRLIIPSIGVDAPFSYQAVPANGVMPDPDGPEDVAYYDFSGFDGFGGLPNAGGNVVLAGHVDYVEYGEAVFWDLEELAIGDRVQVRMTDGSVVEYEVAFNKHVDVEDPANASLWNRIVEATEVESLTIITCSGEFSAGHYNNRQVVWARRVGV